MRRVYWVWALGLLLKGIGASWDVSWHFRILRETVSPPHVINAIGGLLCAVALVHEWRHRDQKRTGPLLVILAGVGLFLFAIPFDEWWHRTFGVDLTTWSPAHMMLFTGTMMSVFGLLMMFVGDLARGRSVKEAVASAGWTERGMLALLVVVLAGAVYFPLTYNEYTTVAARTALEAPETMDPALVEVARSVEDPVFHGTPRWLYPVYSVTIGAFLGTLVRAWLGRGWALVALGGISAERALVDGILGAAGWPIAALPLQFVAMGGAIELVWIARVPAWARSVAAGVAAAVVGYGYFVAPITWREPVPLTATSWPAGVTLGVLAALLALVLARRGLAYVESVPELRAGDVRAWLAKWTRG